MKRKVRSCNHYFIVGYYNRVDPICHKWILGYLRHCNKCGLIKEKKGGR